MKAMKKKASMKAMKVAPKMIQPPEAKKAMKGDLNAALDAFETLVLEQKAKHAGNTEVRQVLDMLALNYAAV